MIKNLKKYALIACSLFALAACNESEEDLFSHGLKDQGNGNQNKPEAGSTITYRAQVWVEKEDMELLYGGERQFRQNLEKLFRNTTLFWNLSPNKFNYYFEWTVGEGDDNLVIYEVDKTKNRKEEYNKYRGKAYGPLNTERYDFVLFLALGCNPGEGGLSCGGGAASGQSVVNAFFEKTNNIFSKGWPDKGPYSDLGHEYGHVRGAQDLYQYMIEAKNNPISNEAYPYPKCNMGTGYQEWSDYCSAVFNSNAEHKQLSSNNQQATYPKQLLVRVTKGGKPLERAIVNFWGTRATFKDVYNKPGNSPFMERRTNAQGEILIDDVYRMYIPEANAPKTPPKSPVDEFPFSRWYCFLTEVVMDNGQKKCVWLSDLDIVPEYLNGGQKEPYVFEINIP